MNVQIANTLFNLDVAASPESRKIGLLYRTKLEPNTGMVFVTGQVGPVSMWMKGMKFPIDMIFMLGNRIVLMYKNVLPCTIDCPSYECDTCDSVIEVPAGTCDQLGLARGDIIDNVWR